MAYDSRMAMSTSAPVSSAAPRYRQIAAELRRQIEAGELTPGMRVPSTRAIIDGWGVAMATATKGLTELRHQGVRRAGAGVGTGGGGGSRAPPRGDRPPRAARDGGGGA